MVFSSEIFLFYFLPVALAAYYLTPSRWRNVLLASVSYVFYAWWQPWFVFMLLAATWVNYHCGRIIAASAPGARRRTLAVVAAVVASLGLLGFFKYFVFLENNLNRLLVLFGAGALPVLKVALPVGISFYLFQSLSYPLDIHKGRAPPVRSFADFACFVSLFPQLIAGPIIRYNTVAEQLKERRHTLGKFSSGVALFILGLGKKVLLANTVGRIADAVFGACGPGVIAGQGGAIASAVEAPCALDAWFGVCAYAFQIYFDFSGYSDMAVGLGRMFGFEFPKNFDGPYRSESITDFWRRWHISLSAFLRDYLYFPLGGNRRGPRRTYVNLAIVMLLGGLWHGANWTFVLWGAYHGALLALERCLGKRPVYAALPRPLRILATFVLVLFSWVLFRSATIADAARTFAAMFGATAPHGGAPLLAAELYTPANILSMVLCALVLLCPVQAFDWAGKLSWHKVAAASLVLCLAVAALFTQAFNPFLYFQF
jgi:alginate O-acetyltransferase complex protein AlgI